MKNIICNGCPHKEVCKWTEDMENDYVRISGLMKNVKVADIAEIKMTCKKRPSSLFETMTGSSNGVSVMKKENSDE